MSTSYDPTNDNTSANYAVLSTLENIMSDTETDAIDSKLESHLNTATGIFLDEWGKWFGVPRTDGQDDDSYRSWIITYATLKRGTKKAIIDAIKMYLDMEDANISVYEPYKDALRLDEGYLDGEQYLSGDYYRWGIIDIIVDRPVPKSIFDIINDFKPAGVNFYVTIDASTNSNSPVLLAPQQLAYLYSTVSTYLGLDKKIDYQIDVTGMTDVTVKTALFQLDKSKLDDTDVLSGGYIPNIDWDSIIDFVGKAFIYGTSVIGFNDIIGGTNLDYHVNTNNYQNFWTLATIFDSTIFTNNTTTFNTKDYETDQTQTVGAYYTGELKENGLVGINLLNNPDENYKVYTDTDTYYQLSFNNTAITDSGVSELYLKIPYGLLDTTSTLDIDILDSSSTVIKSLTLATDSTGYGDLTISNDSSLFTNMKSIRIYTGIKGSSLNNKVYIGLPLLTSFQTDTWYPFDNDSNDMALGNNSDLANMYNGLSIYKNNTVNPQLKISINVLGELQKENLDIYNAQTGDVVAYLRNNLDNISINITNNATSITVKNGDNWDTLTIGNTLSISPAYLDDNGVLTISLTNDSELDISNFYGNIKYNNLPSFSPLITDDTNYIKYFGSGLDTAFYTGLKYSQLTKYTPDLTNKTMYIGYNIQTYLENIYPKIIEDYQESTDVNTIKNISVNTNLILNNKSNCDVKIYDFDTNTFVETTDGFDLRDLNPYLTDSGIVYLKVTYNGVATINNLFFSGTATSNYLSLGLNNRISMNIETVDNT